MKQRGSPADLAGADGDGWYAAPGVVVWRIASLDGATFWGHVTRTQVEAAFAVARHYADAVPARLHEVVTDVSGVTSVDDDLYLRLSDFLGHLVPRVAPRVRRHVVIVPDGVLGAAAAGILHLQAAHAWQVAADLDAAIGAVLAARVAAIVDPRRDADLVGALRAHVATCPSASLPAVARALGVSPRTLQRALRGADTGFREVSDEARIAAACRLLDGSDLKVEAIAREIGFQSLSGFVRAFRRLRGRSPHEHRTRRSA